MKNISFDNPYWLLLAIPLLLAVLIPYFISKSKDNKSVGWLSSLIIHVVIVAAVTLAAAGLVHTTVITRTKVYILADVSYSANRNLDKIDEYIENISSSLPQNSRLGIVCFGNDSEILTSSGTAIRSVKEAQVDDSGTDIASAIDFTSTLFSEGELKRIILITDGFDTTSDGSTAAAVERAIAKDIKIDAVYLDNNLRDGEAEVQISDVNFTQSTYLDHESTLGMIIESSVENDIMLDLYVKADGADDYTKIDTTVMRVDEGINTASFTLPTNVSGIFDYKVELNATKDTSPHNNTYTFTQTVAGKRSVLLITGKQSDIAELERLYGESAVLDSYLIDNTNKNIPYTVESLSQYDEMIISNVDIREINNINAFIDSADAVISQYGKSLITLGDLYMQNKDDEIFARLEELLPVSFGNANKDAKLYTIVIDISRSMYYARPAQLLVAKDAATKLVSILDDDDYVSLVTLAGESKVELIPTRLGDCREELYSMIQSVQPSQGTFIGEALNLAYDLMKELNFEEKQVMLISDGKTYTHEPEDASEVAERMKNDDIVLSTISVLNHSPQLATHTAGCTFLSELAGVGGGIYYELLYEERVAELVFATIGDELTDAIIEGKTAVNVETYRDKTLEGILDLPDIYGYVNSKPKLDATMVLSVDYEKNSKTTVAVPLYSYREHGNGRVATFTSDISGNWLDGWSDEIKAKFFGNVLSTNTPAERIDYPYELTFEHLGSSSTVEISPTYLNPRAKAKIKITTPEGEVTERQLVFDLNKYYTAFDTPTTGRYHIEITYTYGNHTFVSNTYYNVPYGPEYDSFAVYDVASIHDFMRGLGQISTDGVLNLENDKADVATYEMNFRVPLLILAVSLFVIDVFVRKFKWKDIKGFFSKKAKKKGAKG